MLVFSGFLLSVVLYCAAANLLLVPAFKAVRAFRPDRQKGSSQLIHNFITLLSERLCRIYRINIVRETTMQRLLSAANLKQTPKEYLARVWVCTLLPLPLLLPAAFIHPLMALLPAALCWFIYNHQMNGLKHRGALRRLELEKEMPRFVAYMSNTLKTERNIITCIDTYIANYDTPLTQELSMTAADMRLGNAELALQRFETRSNSPFVSQLVRGLLSSMRGNDMTAYFENLSYTLTNVWEQQLRGQALRKQPKIERMSYILFGVAMVTVFAVIIATLSSTTSILGGL